MPYLYGSAPSLSAVFFSSLLSALACAVYPFQSLPSTPVAIIVDALSEDPSHGSIRQTPLQESR
jgi:hypothetical protein